MSVTIQSGWCSKNAFKWAMNQIDKSEVEKTTSNFVIFFCGIDLFLCYSPLNNLVSLNYN